MQKLKRLAFPALITASITLLLAQCSVGNLLPAIIGKKIWLSDDESALQKEVRRQIPVGSSIADAKTTLQLNGFDCTYKKGSEFMYSAETNLTSKEADYLFCYLQMSQVICAKTYKPFIHYKNEAVTRIDAAIGGWCL